LLTTAVRETGAVAYRVHTIPDDEAQLQAVIEDQLVRADLIIISGERHDDSFDLITRTLSAMGESVFLAKCAPCHGETGDGMNGKAANLNEFGREAHIKNVIKNGSKGLGFPMGEMPAGLADDAAADKIAAYVVTLHGGKATDAAKAAEGQALFVATCGACHGEDGKGMDGSAPNLTQYGTPAFISEVVLKRGKQGHIGGMPSFDKEGTLNPTQYNAVATYIMSEK
jgi:cytochrome c oxidase cbb3-type subunit 3